MKKTISLLLTAAMALSLSACGGAASFNAEAAPTEAPAATEAPTEAPVASETTGDSNTLVAYFSWSGNTETMANLIAEQTGGTLFEIAPATPYTDDYDALLDIAQQEQAEDARPALAATVEDWDSYDVVFVGYPNWWASIPMPIASFLEEYDFSGKTILPFCSHGGGRFGQSLTAIAKLVPDATLGEGLAINYSGGDSMPQDVADWLAANGVNAAQ